MTWRAMSARPCPQAMPDSFYRPSPQSYKGPAGESCVVDKVPTPSNFDNLNSTNSQLEPDIVSIEPDLPST